MATDWNTNPENGKLRLRGAESILKIVPSPRGAASYLQTPIESFMLFFTEEMVNNIVGYTNDAIRPILARFPEVLVLSTLIFIQLMTWTYKLFWAFSISELLRE